MHGKAVGLSEVERNQSANRFTVGVIKKGAHGERVILENSFLHVGSSCGRTPGVNFSQMGFFCWRKRPLLFSKNFPSGNLETSGMGCGVVLYLTLGELSHGNSA